jgi:diguanylate cyclase (GGDEF)-like protein
VLQPPLPGRLPGAAGGGDEERWGCIFIDIDHFKLYNDQFGHRDGEPVLQKMARFLMREIRSGEPVIRLGGDEF